MSDKLPAFVPVEPGAADPDGGSLRLRIEPLRPAHAAELFSALDDARLHRYTETAAAASVEAMAREFERLAAGAPPGRAEHWLNWALRRRDDGRGIGTLQATLLGDATAWIGYALAPAHWGHGYAIEAVTWLAGMLHRQHGVQRLRASVDQRNTASCRVLERCGYTCLGPRPATLRGEATVDLHYRLDIAPDTAAPSAGRST